MSEARRRDPVGGFVGVVAIAIAVSALPLAPVWPAADAPTEVIRAYFVDHGRSFLLQNFLTWVAFVGFSRILIGLAKLIGDAGEREAATTALVGTTVLTVALVFGNAPWVVLAYSVPQNPDVLRALWNLGLVLAFNVAGLAIGFALFPIGIGLIRTRVLPRPYAYFVIATAVNGLLLATCFATSGPMIPNGPIGMASIVTLTIMLLIGSIFLLRKAPPVVS